MYVCLTSDSDNDATHDYTNIKIDSEVVDHLEDNKGPVVAHARNDIASVQRVSHIPCITRVTCGGKGFSI